MFTFENKKKVIFITLWQQEENQIQAMSFHLLKEITQIFRIENVVEFETTINL